MAFISVVPALYYNVKQYGAVGDGTTDDTTAINAAITAAQNAGGGTVVFPPGTYIVSTPLVINHTNMGLRGSGSSSILKIAAGFSGAAVIYTASAATAANITIQDITIQAASSTYSSNPACDGIQLNSDVSNLILENISIRNVNGWAIQTIDGSTGGIGYMRMNGVFCTLTKAGFHFQSVNPNTNQGGGFTITNCVADNCGNGDAWFFDGVGDNNMTNSQGYTQTGGSSLHLKGCVFSYFTELDLGGATPNQPCVLLENGYSRSNSHITLDQILIQKGTVGLKITGGADRIRVTNSDVYFNQGHGIEIDDNAANDHILISGCQFFQNNTGATSSQYDITNLSTHGHVMIRDCQFGNNGATTLAAMIDSTSTGDVQGCEFSAVSAYPVFSSHKPSLIRGNQDYNPVGQVTAPSFPATTVASTNSTGVDVTAYIANGTAAITVVQVAGASGSYVTTGYQIAANGWGSVRLPAGGSVKFTYASGAPTWTWFGD